MCEEQKGNIVHEGPRTSASVLHSDKEGKFASQVACGSCFQTIPTSLQQMKTIPWEKWSSFWKASQNYIHLIWRNEI